MDTAPENNTPQNDMQQENSSIENGSIENSSIENSSIEEKLFELRAYLKKMEKENDELFQKLGISHHQVQNHLNNKDNFSTEVYEFIQKERKALEEILDRRIEETNAAIAPDRPTEQEPIGGHWIFVR